MRKECRDEKDRRTTTFERREKKNEKCRRKLLSDQHGQTAKHTN